MRRSIGCFVLSVLSVLSACKADPTQLIVVVDSDYKAYDELGMVRVEVADATGTVVSMSEFAVVASDAPTPQGEVHLPFSFAVVPLGGDASRTITVSVSGLDPVGKTLVSRRAITGFVRNQTRRLDMFLARACATQAALCTSDQTCTQNGCASANAPPDQLPSATPGQELPPPAQMDASVGGDAVAQDGTSRDGSPNDRASHDAVPEDGPTQDAMSLDGAQPDAPSQDATNADAISSMDATNPDAVADAGVCPSSCSAGGTCNGFCSGTCQACGSNCTCDWSCNLQSCNETCATGSTCTVSVNGPDHGTVTCQPGATCTLNCNDADNCNLDCMGNSQCIMTGCHMFTTDAGIMIHNCNLTCTSTTVTMCPNGVQVCNRACP